MAKIQTLCRRLWRPRTPGRHARTPHLAERQGQRDITDAEIRAAIEHGKRRTLPGPYRNVSYTHKGVVYVASPNGVGLTAYRTNPPERDAPKK